MESTMFFGAGTAVDPAQRASRIYSAYSRLRTNKKDAFGRVLIRQQFEETTKSASAKQDWTTKQAALNFGWVPPVFVQLRVENRLFGVL